MNIPTGHDLNADQIAYWNGPGGQHWTDRQQAQDTLLTPVSDILIDRAKVRAGERIVDVGCGCGANSIAFAQKVGPTGPAFVFDISVPVLAFACWREPRDNRCLMLPLQAAYQHVPKLPQLGPEDPGPFAFASEARVSSILSEAGFTGVAMERCDLSLDVAIGRGLDGAVETALEIGPASRALEGHPPEVRAAAANSIRDALAPFASRQAVRLAASLWIG